MDGFNEKKWFVYLVDHHEGPLSLAEIQGKMGEGQVSRSTYVWAEGMSDWKPMSDISAFGAILNGKGTSPSIAAPAAVPVPKPAGPTSAPAPAPKASPAPTTTITTLSAASHASPVTAADSAATTELTSKKTRVGRLVKWSMAALVPVALGGAYVQGLLEPVMELSFVKAGTQTVSELAEPYLMQAVDRFPALSGWISPIPALQDVSPEDYEDLKSAAMGKVEEKGPKMTLALARDELFTPEFYVASNLSDGAQFDVFVEGVPDTLLNQLSFSAQAKATVTKRMGKTSAIRFPDGKPLARGEYVIYVMESAQQPESVQTSLALLQPANTKLPAHLPKGRKLVAKKTYFLGGNKDATYAERLKEFHEKLRVKATTELSEIKQFATTFESQYGVTTAHFVRLRKGRVSRVQQKAWNDFHGKWLQLDGQLREHFQRWTPEALEKEYFYGSLYQQTQQAAEMVARLHGLHHAYFTGSVDSKSFDIQLGETSSQAQAAISALKAKIEQAEKLPPSPSGMPRREGL